MAKHTDPNAFDTVVVDPEASTSDHDRKVNHAKRACEQLNLAGCILVAVNEVDGAIRVSCDFAALANHPLAQFAVPAIEFLTLAINLNIDALCNGTGGIHPDRSEAH